MVMHMCVRVLIQRLSTIFLFDFGTVSKRTWYFSNQCW